MRLRIRVEVRSTVEARNRVEIKRRVNERLFHHDMRKGLRLGLRLRSREGVDWIPLCHGAAYFSKRLPHLRERPEGVRGNR